MVKRKDSLSTRIMLLTLVAILSSILIIGAIGVFSVKSEGDRDTSRHMNLICDDRSKALNEFLKSVEQSVGMAARYATDDMDSVKLLQGGVIGADGYIKRSGNPQTDPKVQEKLDTYLDEHTARVRAVIRSTANHTHDVYSCYYRINPQLTGRPIGFWFYKKTETSYSRIALTNLSAYSEEDEAYVGWYYKALEAGKPIWLEPYCNGDMGTKIVTYEIPIYKAGTFIGVVGMDISFDTLVELMEDIHLYQSG